MNSWLMDSCRTAADRIIITEYFNFHIMGPTFHDTFLSSFNFQSIQVQEQLKKQNIVQW